MMLLPHCVFFLRTILFLKTAVKDHKASTVMLSYAIFFSETEESHQRDRNDFAYNISDRFH